MNGRAAVFVRYRSGDGAGHVGWAFEYDAPKRIDAGSVENHSGGIHADASHMDFWSELSSDPVACMRKNQYDDVKFVDVDDPDPVSAYETVLWIEKHAYTAILRNCLDDAYDVLRAYGVAGLEPPSHDWFPKNWFAHFNGTQRPVAEFDWHEGRTEQAGGNQTLPDPDSLEPQAPDWRNPLSAVFSLFRLELFRDFFRGLVHRRRRRG
jgi:hypothetical protein